jgi:hypothetical protein
MFSDSLSISFGLATLVEFAIAFGISTLWANLDKKQRKA